MDGETDDNENDETTCAKVVKNNQDEKKCDIDSADDLMHIKQP